MCKCVPNGYITLPCVYFRDIYLILPGMYDNIMWIYYFIIGKRKSNFLTLSYMGSNADIGRGFLPRPHSMVYAGREYVFVNQSVRPPYAAGPSAEVSRYPVICSIIFPMAPARGM